MNDELIKRIDEHLVGFSLPCMESTDMAMLLKDCRTALSRNLEIEAVIGEPNFPYGFGENDKGGSEYDLRNRQIALATKYWAHGVYFKTKYELVEALLGLCILDGEGGDGVALWGAARDAINGILGVSKSRKYVPMTEAEKTRLAISACQVLDSIGYIESEVIRRAGLVVSNEPR